MGRTLRSPLPGRRFAEPPVLVTGAPRSGTTFVGDVLAHARGTRFVYEPFNRQIGLDGLPRQFLHTTEGDPNEDTIAALVEDLLAGRGRLHATTITTPTSAARRAVRATMGSRTNVEYHLRALRGGRRWLLKDPNAQFLAGWFHRRFDAPVVAVVRHPAAVVASYLRLGWTFGINDLAKQPRLVERYDLGDIVGAGHGYGRVETAARLWAATYTVLAADAERTGGVLLVRHEDLSAEPATYFARVYEHTGLSFDNRARHYVAKMTGAHNPAGPRTDQVHTLRRNSRADLGRWRDELSDDDLATVRKYAGAAAAPWYGDDTW